MKKHTRASRAPLATPPAPLPSLTTALQTTIAAEAARMLNSTAIYTGTINRAPVPFNGVHAQVCEDGGYTIMEQSFHRRPDRFRRGGASAVCSVSDRSSNKPSQGRLLGLFPKAGLAY